MLLCFFVDDDVEDDDVRDDDVGTRAHNLKKVYKQKWKDMNKKKMEKFG